MGDPTIALCRGCVRMPSVMDFRWSARGPGSLPHPVSTHSGSVDLAPSAAQTPIPPLKKGSGGQADGDAPNEDR